MRHKLPPQQLPAATSTQEKDEKDRPVRSTRIRLVKLLGAVLLLAAGLVTADWWTCLPADAQATYVGGTACIDCHRPYYDEWKGSHHDLAMDRATPETVLGDFNDVEFTHFDTKSRLFRRDGRYMVHTEGADGKLADFEVKWVFGVDPLQQFMVEFDRPPDMPDHEIARVQVLRICWDTRRKEWFYLPPPDVREKLDPDDDLHWTGIAQRWNNMCADCHSTNLQKNYDVATKMYHTTFSDIDVNCEACHGPGSLHVQLANSKSLFWDRKRGFGLPRLKENAETLIQTCAPCHSRRACIYPDFPPGGSYYDHFASELLQRNTYHADGQILDEDYEFASFIQSKMYHKGIRCTDCHNPHTAKLKYNGNAVCTSCHQHPAGKYDGPAHHHHQPDSTGAACVECHMPQTTYMEVHPRRDHSLRNPRPDLSIPLGLPNACTRCHLDKKKAGLEDRDDLRQYLDWILAARNGDQKVKAALATVDQEMHKAFQEWYGSQNQAERRFDKYFAPIVEAARRGEPRAEPDLIRVARDGRLPNVVRATALLELGQYGNRHSIQTALDLLADPHPTIRATAVENLQGLDNEQLARSLAPLLSDPVRLVRLPAARTLASVPSHLLRGSDREELRRVLAEFERGLLVNNDRATSHLALGSLYESLRDDHRALEAYQTAMHVEPQVTGARGNVAAVYDRLAEAGECTAEAATRYRAEAVRLRREELDCLARDIRLAPDAAFLQYRYGMLLYLHRRFEEAEAALRKASDLEPNNPQFLMGVVLFYKEQGQPEKAVPLAEKLASLRPDDEMYRQILRELRP